MAHPSAPTELQIWIEQPPTWLDIQPVRIEPDAKLDRLHPGEREAIALAEQLGADLILLDEKAARQIAAERGLNVTGLLGILDEAATRGLIDLPTAIDRLRQTTFRASPWLLKWVLYRHQNTK
jgi:predicted nucleic acid-binding protein